MKLTALAAAVGLVMSSGAFAETTASHDVSILVSAINEITVDQTEVAFVIDGESAVEGEFRTEVLPSSWGIFTNTPEEEELGVSAKLDAAVGTGLTLEVTATGPTGSGEALTGVELNNDTAMPVVQDIIAVDELAGNPLALSYKLFATKAAPAGYTNSVTVTYTITGI
jgi:hypothetical protein